MSNDAAPEISAAILAAFAGPYKETFPWKVEPETYREDYGATATVDIALFGEVLSIVIDSCGAEVSTLEGGTVLGSNGPTDPFRHICEDAQQDIEDAFQDACDRARM